MGTNMNKSADESALGQTDELSSQPAVNKKGLRYYFRLTWPIKFIKGRWLWWIKPELYQWKLVILMHIPGRIGSFLRTRLMNFGACGRNVLIEDHVWLQRPEYLKIGDDCRIHRLCYFDAIGGIEIGSHTGIGSGTQIYSVNHKYKDKNRLYNEQGYELAKVVIEEDVWIGSKVFIGAGVRIRKGTIVAASAVVTKDTEEYSVVAGVPAVKIGSRI
jgi:acetyltransferase-like isoleucine patch superfamily enzyme